MTHFQANFVKRSHDEIEEMCKDMRTSLDTHSAQFDRMTYEQGVIAAIRWLFFDNAAHPSDIKDDTESRVADAQRDVMRAEHAQALESGSEG